MQRAVLRRRMPVLSRAREATPLLSCIRYRPQRLCIMPCWTLLYFLLYTDHALPQCTATNYCTTGLFDCGLTC